MRPLRDEGCGRGGRWLCALALSAMAAALVGCGALDPNFGALARSAPAAETDAAPTFKDRTEYYPGPDQRRSRRVIGYLYPDGRFERDGVQLEWHPNGQPRREEHFDRGLRDGSTTEWDEDGTPVAEEHWESGRRIGTWRTWYPGGAPRSQVAFGGDGPHAMTWWHENGAVSSQGPARDGVREGAWTFWYATGAEQKRGAFEEGLRSGPWVFWFEDGSLEMRGSYDEDARIGTWEWWDPGVARLADDGSLLLTEPGRE